MRYWKQLAAGVLIATAVVDWRSFSIRAEPNGTLIQRAGSEVYIDQPPKNVLERSDQTLGKAGKD